MKNTLRKTYNKKSYDPFQDGQVMDYCTAKGYIDDAWAMRAKAREAILAYRECGLKGDLLHTSYFCGVLKKTMKDYRRAQRLCVRAYHKCMADTVKSRSQYF
jgi:hypothetical protein